MQLRTKEMDACDNNEDNNPCIEWGNNIIGCRERAKHIDIRNHFAHEAIQNGHVRLVRVDTSEHLADIFTKGLHQGACRPCTLAPACKVCISSILNGGRKPLP